MAAAARSGGQPWIETWLLDANGEVVGEEPIKTAYAYASELEALWRTTDRHEALLEQNRDAMEDATKSDPAAAEIIASLEAPLDDFTVPIPTMRDGKNNVGQYLRDFKAAIDSIDSPAFNDWVAANMANVVGMAATTRPLLMKIIVDRANAIGMPPPRFNIQDGPTASPTAAAPPPASADQDAKDRRQADNILEELKRLTEYVAVELYSNNATVAIPIKRWRAEGKFALVDEILAAFTERHLALGGKPKSQPAP